jgi:hypothetical protein
VFRNSATNYKSCISLRQNSQFGNESCEEPEYPDEAEEASENAQLASL